MLKYRDLSVHIKFPQNWQFARVKFLYLGGIFCGLKFTEEAVLLRCGKHCVILLKSNLLFQSEVQFSHGGICHIRLILTVPIDRKGAQITIQVGKHVNNPEFKNS